MSREITYETILNGQGKRLWVLCPRRHWAMKWLLVGQVVDVCCPRRCYGYTRYTLFACLCLVY